MKTIPVIRRDLGRAKALLAEAGVRNPKVELIVAEPPCQLQVAEMIQAMTKEAGFETRLLALETGTAVQKADRGDHEAMLLGWPGFVDPDQNIDTVLSCKGTLNYSGYCNADFDRLLERRVPQPDIAERVTLYTNGREILAR